MRRGQEDLTYAGAHVCEAMDLIESSRRSPQPKPPVSGGGCCPPSGKRHGPLRPGSPPRPASVSPNANRHLQGCRAPARPRPAGLAPCRPSAPAAPSARPRRSAECAAGGGPGLRRARSRPRPVSRRNSDRPRPAIAIVHENYMIRKQPLARSQFARVVKGVDLRSAGGNSAWIRTPQLTSSAQALAT